MEFLTTSEVASILRLSTGHVRCLCEQGKLPAKRTCGTSGQWRIDRAALLAQVNEVRVDDSPAVVKRPEVKIVEWPSVFEEVRNRVRKRK